MAAGPDGSGGYNIYAGTMGEGVYRSTDDGDTWTPINNGLTVPLAWFMLPVDNGSGGTTLYLGSYGGGVFTSTNNGDTWVAAGPVPGAPLITSIIVEGSNLFAASWSSGVFFSTDGGTSWMPVNNGLTNTFVNTLFKDGSNLYAGTLGGVYYSTDNGASWTMRNNGMSYAGSVYAFARVNDVLVAGLGSSSIDPGGIYKSTDGGQNWEQINDGLTNTNIRDFTTFNGYVYTGTYGGGMLRRPVSEVPVEFVTFTAEAAGNEVVLQWTTATETNNRGFSIERSSLQGSNWQEIGFVKGSGTTSEQRSYSFKDNDLTNGKYSYRLKQVDLDGSFTYSNVVEVQVNQIMKFALDQNYPNPFNPTTNISFVLEKESYVTLRVFNSLGQQVAELISGLEKAGSHNVTFNGSGLSSGVYYYRIESGSNVSVKKMMFIK